MEEAIYSKIYPRTARDYRYNYITQRLERIEKRVCLKKINGITCSVVESEITAEFDIRHQLWDKIPEYWVQLCDSK